MIHRSLVLGCLFLVIPEMESHDTSPNLTLNADTINYLIGDQGRQTLVLINQGCVTNADITKLSSISNDCLEVKIPLLITLGLITDSGTESNGYSVTNSGKSYLREATGWHD
ncbi:MAG: hypothetical protein ACTSU3_06865 [Candidatus Thorarchaeota archaeon]